MVSKTAEMEIITSIVVRIFAAWLLYCSITSEATVLTTETKAIMYLQKYGYMKKMDSSFRADSAPIVEAAVLSQALKDFQDFAGLHETGILDEPTLNMMIRPRCGVPDIFLTGPSRIEKRYVLQGSKWNKKSLTYRISKYPETINDKSEVDKDIAEAFKVWSNVTSINFEVSEYSAWFSSRVDIEIRFEKGKDGHGFDGPGGILASGFFPQYGGDIFFDDEEDWTIGKHLLQVAIHELGHSLGLRHSKNKDAVMYPFFERYKRKFHLHVDDVHGIQVLYGPPRKIAAPDLCGNPSIDAATNTMDGNIYVFKDIFYWKIGEAGIIDGYPRIISEDWDGVPGNLDAALTTPRGKTYLFKGNQFWRCYNNKDIASGFPLNISDGIPDVPDHIDTAFFWKGEPYFFKGNMYTRCVFKNGRIQRCLAGGRLPIHDFWEGLPTDIDAAFQWKNEKTYFLKENKYYRINDTTHSTVGEADPPYPRSTSIWWFGCPNLCQDSTIDAATTTEDGQTYVFKGNYYWAIEEAGISDGYPRKISDDWPGLPGDLDAAVNMSNGRTYFFKKNLYWRFHNKSLDSGFPKHISDGVPGIPSNIDFAWSLNDNIYFFKGNYYWRYEFNRYPHVSEHYPQPISNWKGLPNKMDAALRWRSNTYFFKEGEYYKWNDETASVAMADPPYPRSTYLWWFNCDGWEKPVAK